MIYLLMSPVFGGTGNLYKIGYASSLESRLNQYIAHNPGIRLVSGIPGDRTDEYMFHRYFHLLPGYRFHRDEWYLTEKPMEAVLLDFHSSPETKLGELWEDRDRSLTGNAGAAKELFERGWTEYVLPRVFDLGFQFWTLTRPAPGDRKPVLPAIQERELRAALANPGLPEEGARELWRRARAIWEIPGSLQAPITVAPDQPMVRAGSDITKILADTVRWAAQNPGYTPLGDPAFLDPSIRKVCDYWETLGPGRISALGCIPGRLDVEVAEKTADLRGDVLRVFGESPCTVSCRDIKRALTEIWKSRGIEKPVTASRITDYYKAVHLSAWRGPDGTPTRAYRLEEPLKP